MAGSKSTNHRPRTVAATIDVDLDDLARLVADRLHLDDRVRDAVDAYVAAETRQRPPSSPPPPSPPRHATWRTVAEAADDLRMTDRGVRKMIADGRLPAYRIGGKALRIRSADLAALARRLPTVTRPWPDADPVPDPAGTLPPLIGEEGETS